MVSSSHIVLFGDQTNAVEDKLRGLIADRSNVILVDFLRTAFCAVQRSIHSLPSIDAALMPRCETLGLMIDAVQSGTRHVALDNALLCTYEIGLFLSQLSRQHKPFPPPSSSTIFAGVCVGSLAAAALSCARSVFDIPRLGEQAVTVAFRIGLYVHRKAATQGYSSPSSWSTLISGIGENEVKRNISTFCTEMKLTPSSRPYVSAVSPSGVTVSGPPAIVSSFLALPPIASKRQITMPIYGPYHSEDIYSQMELDRIRTTVLEDLVYLDRTSHTRVLSCVTGEAAQGLSFGTLLETAAKDILTRQVRLDKLIGRLADTAGEVTLTPINMPIAGALTSALSRGGVNFTIDLPVDEECCTDNQPRQAQTDDEKIAIIGYSGRFPEADGLDEFWSLLQNGLDVHKPVPASRFDAEAHYDATLKSKNTSRIKHGCWLKNPGLFDARFFRLSPREVTQTDPAQRLALVTAYEALEMAGFVADRTPSSQRHRVGVYYGSTSDDWREVNNAQNIDTYFIPGTMRAFMPGRINYHFKFSGPSVSVDTACSSSLATINIAISALMRRDCDTAIAGGTSILTGPDNFAGLDRGHFLSVSGNCNTFDDGADGYCRAEGVGTVVLKRLSDAIADNDPIFGVVLGAQTNHSADAVSITRPASNAQALLFRSILSKSQIDPFDISYVEMHGTGTQAGDVAEMDSVLQTLAWDYSRGSDRPLYLGSVKSNIGHGESASGVMSLIKVLLMMKYGKIPPHCGIKTKINRGFPTDLGRRGVRIERIGTDWKQSAGSLQKKRRAFINNFSAAGGNTAILLEDAPSGLDSRTHHFEVQDPRTSHVIVVSARSRVSLQRNLAALAEYVTESTSLSHLSYTTTARRLHHNYRVAVVANTATGLQKSLLESADSADTMNPIPTKVLDVGFLFTGQGVQYTGMASSLFRSISSFRDDILDFNHIMTAQGFDPMLPLLDGSADIDQMSATVVQVGACIIQIALARLWANLGVFPSYVIGHSLGEYAAMHVAGILSVSDAIYLCGYRATLLESRGSRGTHGMVAVRTGADEIRFSGVLADSQVEISCVNGPQETVLSGNNSSIDIASQKLSDIGYSCTKLAVPFAFHSSQVDPILSELEEAAKSVVFKPAKIPFVSTLLGDIVKAGDDSTVSPAYIARHCREPVNFLDAVKVAHNENLLNSTGACIEIGAHPVLTRLIGSMSDVAVQFCAASLHRKENDLATLTKSLSKLYMAGVDLKWEFHHGSFPSCQTVLTLPTYAWDLENYWHQYQGNWCLTRGDQGSTTLPTKGSQMTATRLSSSVHEIVEEVTNDDESFIVSQSDVHDRELFAVADQHRVNGLVLMPSGLYADVAYTLTSRLIEKRFGNETTVVPDVGNMLVEKALIIDNEAHQYFRASVAIDWHRMTGTMEVYSVSSSGSGNTTKQHATCTIAIQNTQQWQSEWNQKLYLIKRGIHHLEQQNDTAGSTVHKVRQGMAYKIFSQLVEYGNDYRGMQEVLFDSKELEGSAKVCLNDVKGKFMLNPYWYDSVAHLTGYLLHSNDILDLKEFAYINQGWQYLRLAEPLDPKYFYRTYTKMQPAHGERSASTFSGNLFILRDGKIVGEIGGITFNRVPHRILDMLLPPVAAKPTNDLTAIKKVAGIKTPVSSPEAALASESLVTKAHKSVRAPPVHVLSLTDKALELIAGQIGVPISKMTDDVLFADYGVDSLSSLTIMGMLREKLNIDFSGTFFDDFPSVEDFKAFLEPDDSLPTEPTSRCSSTESSASACDNDPLKWSHTPIEKLENVISVLLIIMEEETGVSRKDLAGADNLGDYGVDSLVSLTVIGRARQESGIDIPNDILMEHCTIGDVQTALEKWLRGISVESNSIKDQWRNCNLSSAAPKRQPGGHESLAPPTILAIPMAEHPQATSLILQGNTNSSSNLFLFPDGSGSATSAVGIPAISPSIRLYGLNSPYVKNPLDLKCQLPDLTPAYIAEIRRRQPKGPYNLAGWSAGGLSAFHAAQVLSKQGDRVDRLILIDAPNPIGIRKLPSRFYTFLETAGVFGTKVVPKWLTQHFESFNDALVQYHPVPFQSAEGCPQVTIIWAKDGVLKNNPDFDLEAKPDDTREMRWLLEDRQESALGPYGWDEVIPEEKITITSIEDANHFSLVRQPAAVKLADAIHEAMRMS